ncbi:MAG TPA: adenosine kinase [Alphaproteobacteria bacterium]|nr:adenosine kinase [Alphaproteobacteria bacterium]
MTNKEYGVIGLGSAIVDIISYKKQEFLDKNNLPKGAMKLVDAKTAKILYEQLGVATECSGGSSANTIAGFSLLGGKSAFIGKTKNDYLGKIFKKEIEKAGAKLIAEPSEKGASTSKCIIIVTEEELEGNRKRVERTMATYLDFDVLISEQDIKEEDIKNSEILFFEGYLFDNPDAKAAVKKAIKFAKIHNTKVAFTLSDPFCVQRHKNDFIKLCEQDADIIFANENESLALYEGADLREVLHKFIALNAISCLTKGDQGSYVIESGKIYDIEAVKVDEVYDVTGAGDMYAAGFLYGLTQNYNVEKCGHIASLCAAEVIKYLGARPVTDMKKLIATI